MSTHLISKSMTEYIAIILSMIFVCCAPSSSQSAPDDRGPKGAVLSIGGGGFFTHATGLEGEALEPGFGGSYSIGIREEVWPRLMLGLHIGGYMGGHEQYQSFSLNGLLFDVRWRFGENQRGTVLMGGLGIGGGGFTDPIEGEDNASAGGALWRLALGYEFGSKEPGWSFTPSLAYEQLRAQMDSKVSVGVLSFNLEVAWEIGR